MDGPILGLMKFGEKKYMDDFRLNGTIYMNTLLFFRTLENKGDVGDEFEGLDACYQSDKVNIKITTADGKSIILSADDGSLAGQIKTRNDSTDFLNVYCMYMIRYCKKMPLIDERNLVFGDTYVCITDKDKFFERILSAAKNANVEIAGRPVKYVSRDSHHGKMDVFTKFDKYSYQSEFRLVVYPGFGEVFKLQLGDLSDITIMGRLKNINDDIEIVELSHPPGDAK